MGKCFYCQPCAGWRLHTAGEVCLLFFLTIALVAGAGCESKKSNVARCPVVIESKPISGAQVIIDGTYYGETPLTIQEMPRGTHLVALEKDLYRPASSTIEVGPIQSAKAKEGETLEGEGSGKAEVAARAADTRRKPREEWEGELHFVIEMEPVTGFLTVTSEPTEAEVRLGDGTLLGTTPLMKHALPVGEYDVEIVKANYHPRKEHVSVKGYFQYEFRETLDPMLGKLNVYSRPSGATVWVNNLKQPQRTPAVFEIPPGYYLVGAHVEGFIQGEDRVELVPNGKAEVRLDLKPGNVPPGMLLIPAGEFIFGEDNRAPDEVPRHSVSLQAFYIDKYEVTNADFKAVFPNHKFDKGMDEYPVAGISWHQADEYARRVGKRLPSEREWERAARGTDGREYPWGITYETDSCNAEEFARKKTMPVSAFLKGMSADGCMNMAGNVYEWCQDMYQKYPGNNVVTKEYGQSFRILRGGSYDSARFNVRCARRHFDHFDAHREDYGFRCAKDVQNGAAQ